MTKVQAIRRVQNIISALQGSGHSLSGDLATEIVDMEKELRHLQNYVANLADEHMARQLLKHNVSKRIPA